MIDNKRILSVSLALLVTGTISFAAGLDTARDRVWGNPPASVAADVLDQLLLGTIPPTPPVVGGFEACEALGFTLPELPDNAGSTAVSVLDQISQGIIPPIPPVVDGPHGGGPPEPMPPALPDNASLTAVSVLDQISQGIIPPTPPAGGGPAELMLPTLDGQGSAGPVDAGVVPEPATLSLLGLGGLLLARRRKK